MISLSKPGITSGAVALLIAISVLSPHHVLSFTLDSSRLQHGARPLRFKQRPAVWNPNGSPGRVLHRITTTANDDDQVLGQHSAMAKLAQACRKAMAKFRARPTTYLIIPCIAALVGWFTNYLAVQMIFYPIHFRGLPIWRGEELPLGFLGWQGIVPCKTRPMTLAMVHMVKTDLLTVKDAFAKLDPRQMATLLAPEVPKMVEEIVADIAPKMSWMSSMPRSFFLGLPEASKRATAHFNYNFLLQMSKDMIQNIESCFNIDNCVVQQMLVDRSLLGQLFKRCGQKELDFLTNSGLWFGFLLGLIQMFVALFWENPWTLSIGGAIVGLATNWLALKWIFAPVNPTKIGPFVLQGLFLRRQVEVAAEFSNFFANRILTSQQVWNAILTDPTTAPSFHALVTRHFTRFASRVTGALRLTPEPEVIGLATAKVIEKLPDHISVLHPYIDKTLGLEQILRVKMEQMTSVKFERVLHPIFEEDELTLILAGAALGFIAGLIQQGLETGQLKLANPFKFIARRIRAMIKRKDESPDSKSLEALESTVGMEEAESTVVEGDTSTLETNAPKQDDKPLDAKSLESLQPDTAGIRDTESTDGDSSTVETAADKTSILQPLAIDADASFEDTNQRINRSIIAIILSTLFAQFF